MSEQDASGTAEHPDCQHEEVQKDLQGDDFCMFAAKVQPCRKQNCTDWHECPYSHPGERATRRDPRLHSYTGLNCPNIKKNQKCPRGDACHFAHNVFEYWLHPTRYHTELCTSRDTCQRKMCFFAHCEEELRHPEVEASVPQDVLEAMAADKAAETVQKALPGMKGAAAAKSQAPKGRVMTRAASDSLADALQKIDKVLADAQLQTQPSEIAEGGEAVRTLKGLLRSCGLVQGASRGHRPRRHSSTESAKKIHALGHNVPLSAPLLLEYDTVYAPPTHLDLAAAAYSAGMVAAAQHMYLGMSVQQKHPGRASCPPHMPNPLRQRPVSPESTLMHQLAQAQKDEDALRWSMSHGWAVQAPHMAATMQVPPSPQPYTSMLAPESWSGSAMDPMGPTQAAQCPLLPIPSTGSPFQPFASSALGEVLPADCPLVRGVPPVMNLDVGELFHCMPPSGHVWSDPAGSVPDLVAKLACLQASRQTSGTISDMSASELGLESSQASACGQFATLDSLKHGF